MKIVLATHNRHKVAEFTRALQDFEPEILSLDDFPQVGEIDETGTTLSENALLKARTVQRLTGRPAIADDTGLEVDALGGAPGVYSARWAGAGASYADNNRKLLTELASVPADRRRARFRCVIAYVDDRWELTAEGTVEGSILDRPAGSGGFGYDPVFWLPELQKTLAELTPEEKNAVSHRGFAIRNFRKLFSEKIQPGLNEE
ncbi:MAG: XTP/dITP diphosphatase [Candidatus Neomarinimicrobiota bacterium]